MYGRGPARRYRAATGSSPEVLAVREDRVPPQIPLSPDSTEALAYIDQPLEARKPVGCQREFLDAYEPNRTWYLPEPLRRQLRRMGDTRALWTAPVGAGSLAGQAIGSFNLA